MAYGWEVRGPTGKIVADSNSPNLMAVAKGTLSLGLEIGSGTTTQACDWDATNRSNINRNIYRATLAAPGVGEMYFFEVPNGHRVHTLKRAGPVEVWSTTDSLRWVRARFMRWVPRPADTYGIEVRDSAGRLTYHSGANLLTMLGTVQSAPGGMWVSPETSFVFVTDVGQAFIPGVSREGGALIAQGFKPGSIYAGVTGNYWSGQRVRGLVADIAWNEV